MPDLIEALEGLCSKCGGPRDSEFYYCKACRSAYNKEWRAKNPDRVKAYQRGTYQPTPCVQCGDVREGTHRNYCDTCWPSRPCTRCGDVNDGSHPSYCKSCLLAWAREQRAKDPERFRAYQREYAKREDVKAKKPDWAYKAAVKKFGLTVEDVQRMYAEQAGRCYLCYREIFLRQGKRGAVDAAAIDHDHHTGVVRKLLCGNCNPMLGLAGESTEVLRAAADYLESFRDSSEKGT